MKFSEKLQKLRKENNMSQEQLADKLDVSRQSVSKWESGQTYPEMDKLLTMCKLFNITLDDLTNDEVQYSEVKTKNKNSFDNLVDDVMYIIDKTFVMFSTLEAKERGKVIGELIVLFLILLLFRLPFEYISFLGHKVLYYLPKGAFFFQSLWAFIINIIYLILFVFTFLYIYKTYFLDKYKDKEKVNTNKEKPISEENNNNIIKEEAKEKEQKQEEHKKNHDRNYGIGTTLFEILSKITSFCFKTFLVFVSIPFIITFIVLFIALFLIIVLICKGIFYFGFLVCSIAGIALNWLLLKIIASLLFNYKPNFKIMFATFIIGISLTGIGSGLIIFDFASTEIINEAPETKFELITKSYEYQINDNLVITNCADYGYYGCYFYNNDYEYIVDDNLKDTVKIEINYYKDLLYIDTNETTVDKYHVFQIWNNVAGYNKYILENFLDNLKKKKIYNYEKLYEYKIVIKSSSDNINKLKTNRNEFTNYKYKLDLYETDEYYENKLNELYNNIYNLSEEIESLKDENNTLKEKIQNYKQSIENLD